MAADTLDSVTFGHRVRHLRKAAGLTLSDLGAVVGKPTSYLSQLENGHTEPRLSLIGQLAAAVGATTAELLDPSPPNRRAALEIAIERAQNEPLYADLKLPRLKPTAKMPDLVLEHVVGLYESLKQGQDAPVTNEGRAANVELRDEMRDRNNYFAHIEELAGEALSAAGYNGTGPISERTLMDLAAHFGYTVQRVQDMPRSARSITDQRGKVIYVPQRNEVNTRAARSVILQTLGHFALDHTDTDDLRQYLRQRVESNYFSAAVLAPEAPAVEFLQAAYEDKDLSVEDLKEIFYISYEMAAHRMTNLATEHLGLTTHFLRSDEDGRVWKAYENDDVPLPSAVDGVIVGQRLCREWGTRQAFESSDTFALHYQYTDTDLGEFWCVTHVEADRSPHHAVTLGTDLAQAQFFRGSDTDRRTVSQCPDPSCCRTPSTDLVQRWQTNAWPSAADRSHIVAGLPVEQQRFSRFPGVDLVDVYEFLDHHG